MSNEWWNSQRSLWITLTAEDATQADMATQVDNAWAALLRLAATSSMKGALDNHELRRLSVCLENHGELTQLSVCIHVILLWHACSLHFLKKCYKVSNNLCLENSIWFFHLLVEIWMLHRNPIKSCSWDTNPTTFGY